MRPPTKEEIREHDPSLTDEQVDSLHEHLSLPVMPLTDEQAKYLLDRLNNTDED